MDAFVVTLIMTDQEDFILQSLEPLGLFDNNTKYLLIPVNTENASGSHWLLALLIHKEGKYFLKIFNSGHFCFVPRLRPFNPIMDSGSRVKVHILCWSAILVKQD